LTKEQAATIAAIHEPPPPKVEPTGLNQELRNAVLAFTGKSRLSTARRWSDERCSLRGKQTAPPPAVPTTMNNPAERQQQQQDVIRHLEDLVRRGASVHESNALQSAAAANNSNPVFAADRL